MSRDTKIEKAIILLGNVLLIICTFLPYVEMNFLEIEYRIPLIGKDNEMGSGIFFIIFAAVGIVFTLMDNMMIVFASTALSVILMIVEINSLSHYENDAALGFVYQKGTGFYMMIVGVAVTVVGFILERKMRNTL